MYEHTVRASTSAIKIPPSNSRLRHKTLLRRTQTTGTDTHTHSHTHTYTKLSPVYPSNRSPVKSSSKLRVVNPCLSISEPLRWSVSQTPGHTRTRVWVLLGIMPVMAHCRSGEFLLPTGRLLTYLLPTWVYVPTRYSTLYHVKSSIISSQ